jgi:hypothetical protein
MLQRQNAVKTKCYKDKMLQRQNDTKTNTEALLQQTHTPLNTTKHTHNRPLGTPILQTKTNTPNHT